MEEQNRVQYRILTAQQIFQLNNRLKTMDTIKHKGPIVTHQIMTQICHAEKIGIIITEHSYKEIIMKINGINIIEVIQVACVSSSLFARRIITTMTTKQVPISYISVTIKCAWCGQPTHKVNECGICKNCWCTEGGPWKESPGTKKEMIRLHNE